MNSILYSIYVVLRYELIHVSFHVMVELSVTWLFGWTGGRKIDCGVTVSMRFDDMY